MSNLETPQSKEDPMTVVRKKIGGLYGESASTIVQALGDNPLCIVTGTFGIGKTKNLIPQIQEHYLAEDVPVYILDNQWHQQAGQLISEMDKFVPISDGKKGVLILDEAGVLPVLKGEEEVKNFLQAAKSKNYRVIAVIAHSPDSNLTRDKAVGIWQTSGEAPVIELPLFRLDKELAREYLLARAAETRGSFNEEVLNYLLDTVPLNLLLLSMLGQMWLVQRTVEDTRGYIFAYLDRLLFTSEERNRFRRKLYTDCGWKSPV